MKKMSMSQPTCFHHTTAILHTNFQTTLETEILNPDLERSQEVDNFQEQKNGLSWVANRINLSFGDDGSWKPKSGMRSMFQRKKGATE